MMEEDPKAAAGVIANEVEETDDERDDIDDDMIVTHLWKAENTGKQSLIVY